MSVVPVELRRFEPVSDVLVLAAVERAERHRERQEVGVWLPHIAAHLGFVAGSWTTRRLRPQLQALVSAGALSCSRRHGLVVWALTGAGRRRLGRARQAGEVGELPESPQHRQWRHARAAAGERIEGFREQARGFLDEAGWLLDAEHAPSDAWFELGERLARACRRMGSATYCLGEWREPDDARADIDDRCEPADDGLDRDARWHRESLRAGRRNTGRWDDPANLGIAAR